MRGTLLLQGLSFLSVRFIPAHAGNTAIARATRRLVAVHPRACGEHRRSCCRVMPISGSSPRMRGTPVVFPADDLVGRFIPAHAGNTADTARASS